MKPENTLADLRDFASVTPLIGNFPDRLLASTYADFVRVLYLDVDKAVSLLQESAELCKEDGENRLTIDLKGKLNMLGYNATHDEKIRGHTDITVRAPFGAYTWIGEAKIFRGVEYVYGGFDQLCTRYSVGSASAGNEGGMIVYIQTGDGAASMVKWREKLQQANLEQLTVEECTIRPGESFYTVHKHSVSGQPYRVRHIPVFLHYDPKK